MASAKNFKSIHKDISEEKAKKYFSDLKRVLEENKCEVFVEDFSEKPMAGKFGVTTLIGKLKIFIPSNIKGKEFDEDAMNAIKRRRYVIKRIPSDAIFGGEADLVKDTHHVYLGFGTTTSERSGPVLVRLFKKPVIRYEMKKGSLRDSFLLIGKNRVVIHKENFTNESYLEIKRRFSAVIELDKKDMERVITNSIIENNKLITTKKATKKFVDIFKKEGIEIVKIEFSDLQKQGFGVKDFVLEMQ